jgi:Sugar (and other) transporter
VGAVNVLSTLVAVFGVDRLGRRVLLLEAGVQMFIAEILVAILLGHYFASARPGTSACHGTQWFCSTAEHTQTLEPICCWLRTACKLQARWRVVTADSVGVRLASSHPLPVHTAASSRLLLRLTCCAAACRQRRPAQLGGNRRHRSHLRLCVGLRLVLGSPGLAGEFHHPAVLQNLHPSR